MKMVSTRHFHRSRNVCLATIGAGGHALAVIAVAEKAGFNTGCVLGGVYDPDRREPIAGYSLARKVGDLRDGMASLLALQDNQNRQVFFDSLSKSSLVPLIATSSRIAETTTLGLAVQLMPLVALAAETSVGDNTILNSEAVVEDQSQIGSHCHVSANATIAGNVRVRRRCLVGACMVIIENTILVDDVVVGA